MSCLPWCLLLVVCGFAVSAVPDPPTLSRALSAALSSVSSYYNISFVAAITLADREQRLRTSSGAAGMDDRVRGTPMTVDSQIPGGSATKPFTATAAMGLVEAGLLDIDRPAYKYIDPWLANQTDRTQHMTLLQLWNGNRQILQVSTRMLLGMRSGVGDYDDAAMLNYQLENPRTDITPFEYVLNVSKDIPFTPGSGGRYSSVGYVLLGMVLSAASGAPTWEALDQTGLAFRGGQFMRPADFPGIQFMKHGLCSTVQGVAHQYVFHTQKKNHRDVWGEVDVGFEPGCSEQSFWHPNLVATYNQPSDLLAGPFSCPTAAACCAEATARAGDSASSVWTFLPAGVQSAHKPVVNYSTCSVFASAHPLEMVRGAVTGTNLNGLMHLEDFVDLFQTSCLNGWTMGNIASTAAGYSSFFAALATGRLVNSTSLAQMLEMSPTSGELPGGAPAYPNGTGGTPYGLGLFSQYVHFDLGITKAACAELPCCCECDQDAEGGRCWFSPFSWGHGGLDWGSGFPMGGWIPALNFSFSLGVNVGEGFPSGMNTTMTRIENEVAYGTALCAVMNATVQTLFPRVFPNFVGFDLGHGQAGPCLY